MTLRWMQKAGEYTSCEDWETPGWECDLDNQLNVCRWQNKEGHPAIITLEPDTTPYDWIRSWGMFLVSERLRVLLEEFQVPAEYLPVTVMQHGKEIEIPRYYCCNLLNAVYCFDFENGEGERYPSGTLKHLKVFRIDEDKARGHHLFRLGEAFNHVLISDELAARIQKDGIKGMMFLTLESWPSI